MEKQIADLQEKVRRLEELNVQLQNDNLVSSLTASFMHEVNNLTGIGVTAASVLETRIAEAAESLKNGTLKKSDLERFFAEAAETSKLLSVNFKQTADLVSAFKKVAVDRSRRDIRPFMLKDYLEEIIFSLTPRLKKTPHTITLSCPDGIEMVSCPGALSLAIINLVFNSLLHAFPDGRAGHISICAEQSGENIVLTYADDGTGIEPSRAERIFEPFYSSLKNGSGLGLFAVKRMVCEHLKGTVQLRETDKKGSLFEIRIPRVLKL